MKGLCVHAGGRKVTREQVEAVRTPGRVGCHYPIPHTRVLDLARENLQRLGFEVVGAEYALRDGKDGDGKPIEGAEFFGLMELREHSRADGEYGLVAGVRNSHNKSMTSGLVLGSRVFVCDNMAFSGEVKFGRKHTRHILRDLPGLVHEALNRLPSMRGNLAMRVDRYREQSLDDDAARVAIMLAAERDAFSWSKCGKVWTEWKEPRHEAFKPRNAWSLFNAATEVMKEYNVEDLPKRTGVLHAVVDERVGLALAN